MHKRKGKEKVMKDKKKKKREDCKRETPENPL